jgi:hypothetical protein
MKHWFCLGLVFLFLLLVLYCPTNNLPCVIPSEAKESRSEIATLHTLLAMTM